MHEARKLSEAEHFLKGMQREVERPQALAFELSAFLSAARSVLQYACEEAKQKPRGQAWYDAEMGAEPCLRFFKGKRDHSIHIAPVQPPGTTTIGIVDMVPSPRVSLTVSIYDTQGNLVREIKDDSPPPRQANPCTEVTVAYCYRFPDWSGSEDVLSLCQKYLTTLKSVVDRGIKAGFISG
jgi:hypothetical protein